MKHFLRRFIHYYETDAMAIVHHSNHLRIFEEARVNWFRQKTLADVAWSEESLHFPLIESSVRYLKPLYFGDEIEVKMQTKLEGRRFHLQYAIYVVTESKDKRSMDFGQNRGELPILAAIGNTTHVMIDRNFRVVKNLNPKIKTIMEKEPWTETWPSNS